MASSARRSAPHPGRYDPCPDGDNHDRVIDPNRTTFPPAVLVALDDPIARPLPPACLGCDAGSCRGHPIRIAPTSPESLERVVGRLAGDGEAK